MPDPIKNESKEDFIKKFMSSEEAIKSFPDEKQRYAVALSKFKNKNKKKISGQLGNLEIKASISNEVVTEDIAQQYGLSLNDIDQNGFHLIEFDLMLFDEPCYPCVEGELKDKIKQVTFDSSNASEFLASLKNKPIHINSNFDGHYDIAEDGSEEYTVAGSFLGGRIATNDNGDKVARCLAGLYDKSLPKEVEQIKARKKDLGASFELNPTEIEIDEDSMIATVKSWVYSGAAILKKAIAAFPQTSLLIAQRGDLMAKKDLSVPMSKMQHMLKTMDDMEINDDDMEAMMKSMSGDDLSKMNKTMKMVTNKMWQMMAKTEERSNIMEKIYTQEDLDTALMKAKAEIQNSLTASAKAAEVLSAKDSEITELKASLASKDTTIVTLTDKVKTIETEKEESTISASVNTWWSENSKFYEEKDKETILSARKAVLKKEATTEQIDSMIAARKTVDAKKPGDLLGSGSLKEGKDIDMSHGIRAKEGWKRS